MRRSGGPNGDGTRRAPRHLHDRRALDLDWDALDPSPAASAPTTVPGYGLFSTADGNQLSLGVVDEQHFWTALCTVLGRDDLAGLDFAARTADGEALQGAVAVAVAARPRRELIDDLLAAGVPAAPVLDRAAMLDAAEFPDFPIRLDTAARRGRVPFLDENRGEGFHPRP